MRPFVRRVSGLLVVPLLAAVAGCQTPAELWQPCSPAADGNPTGTDGVWVLVCRNGTWEPAMTATEYARLLRGEKITIGPLPTRPTPPAPTTTTPPTTTGQPSTTTTSTTTTSTIPDAPVVASIEPEMGPTSGGTTVTVTGSNFAGATSVSFGSTPATSMTVNSGTQITVMSPAGAEGTVDITVSGPGGTSTTSSASEFTYMAGPTITSIDPSSADFGTQVQVTITGTHLISTNSVFIGTWSLDHTVVSDTEIRVDVPDLDLGDHTITVVTAWGLTDTTFTVVVPVM